MVIHISFPNSLSDKGYYKTASQYLLCCSQLFFNTINHNEFLFMAKCYRQQRFVLFYSPIKILWHVSRVESIFFTNSFTWRKLNKRNEALQLKKKRKREGSETSNLYRFFLSILSSSISLKIYLRKWWILAGQDKHLKYPNPLEDNSTVHYKTEKCL